MFSEREKSLIEILRYFEYLKEYGYKEHGFLYFINAYPSVFFKNHHLNQTVRIIGSDFGSTEKKYSIIIERRRIFSFKVINVSDYYAHFGDAMIQGKDYSLKTEAEFMKRNFIPVLQGERWIDQFI